MSNEAALRNRSACEHNSPARFTRVRPAVRRVELFGCDGVEIIVCPADLPPGAPADLIQRIRLGLQFSIGAFALSNRDTRRGFAEDYFNFELNPGEHWTEPFLEHAEDSRDRAIALAEANCGVKATPQINVDWSTWEISREGGPVEHYMMLFTTMRTVIDGLVQSKVRPRGTQNGFDTDDWHLWSEDAKTAYCVARYGHMADQVRPYAGAHFLPAARRPYHRSLFNPAGVSHKMAQAVRARSGHHVATNLTEVIADGFCRPDDVLHSTALDWPDFGDTIMGRNKWAGQTRDKEVIVGQDTVAGLHRRIDLDHLADPSRPSMAQLREWAANGEEGKLAGFKIFQKTPAIGDGPPLYCSVHELVEKACRAADVTVGNGSARRLATFRWARREKVDGMMLDLLRKAKSKADIEYGREKIRRKMGWKSDQCSNYGSHAEHMVATEEKRAELAQKKAEREAMARGEPVPKPQREMSAAAKAASQHAMERPS